MRPVELIIWSAAEAMGTLWRLVIRRYWQKNRRMADFSSRIVAAFFSSTPSFMMICQPFMTISQLKEIVPDVRALPLGFRNGMSMITVRFDV
jgi:hypothetical protein